MAVSETGSEGVGCSEPSRQARNCPASCRQLNDLQLNSQRQCKAVCSGFGCMCIKRATSGQGQNEVSCTEHWGYVCPHLQAWWRRSALCPARSSSPARDGWIYTTTPTQSRHFVSSGTRDARSCRYCGVRGRGLHGPGVGPASDDSNRTLFRDFSRNSFLQEKMSHVSRYGLRQRKCWLHSAE
jgi:hypothetical protein